MKKGGYTGFGLSVIPLLQMDSFWTPSMLEKVAKKALVPKKYWKIESTQQQSIRKSSHHSVSHNFISARYLENKLIEFHQILCMH